MGSLLEYFISGLVFVVKEKILKNYEELKKSFRNEWSTERCCDTPWETFEALGILSG